jgi:cytochrome c-type biogenesis protein CcsB
MATFAYAMAVATFIENDFGTTTAKAEVYNATWFVILMGLLGLNLLGNMIRFRMYEQKKFLLLLLHGSFIVILLGAMVTKFIGFEGTMHIREGDTTNKIISEVTYLKVDINQANETKTLKESVRFSSLSDNTFDESVELKNQEIHVWLKQFLPNSSWRFVPSDKGKPFIDIMIAPNAGKPQTLQLFEGDAVDLGTHILSFNAQEEFNKEVLRLYVKDDKLILDHQSQIDFMVMDTQETGIFKANSATEMKTRTLYRNDAISMVFKSFIPKATKQLVANPTLTQQEAASYKDALVMGIKIGDKESEITVQGKPGAIATPVQTKVGDTILTFAYGAEYIELPFSLQLIDFQLDRYPGSNSPSSYASEVVLIDEEENINRNVRIFMNNVLDHRNYRFFQSSYDPDEGGTILSVNHDPGTLPTYIGYTMLTLGFALIFFRYSGRYQRLRRKLKAIQEERATLFSALLLSLLIFTPEVKAQELNSVVKTVLSFDKAHANHFANSIMMQSVDGRIKPINTITSDIVNKIYKKKTLLGLDHNQIVLGMMTRPAQWRQMKVIHLGKHKGIKELLEVGESEKYASFEQFFHSPQTLGGYKLQEAIAEAMRKKPSSRTKLDKDVIKIDERVNIALMVFQGSLFTIYPKPMDLNYKWYATIDALEQFSDHERQEIKQLATSYFVGVDNGYKDGNWSEANQAVDALKVYQEKHGAAVMPDPLKIEAEIFYNNAAIFERLFPILLVLGLILLTIAFAKILSSFTFSKLIVILKSLLSLIFIVYTATLILRWYISGHAPWSDGYESMLYIGWATMLAGFIYARYSVFALASTSILTALILFVAHLSWMDPQITNLVPVLKSYWLTIHVSMITASYGFLALGALLGFIALWLFILKTPKNERRIVLAIQELNAINEMALIFGLALLTIGNFLGGVWANESWGRYWGWDPKETWALISIVIYTIIIHLRLIKEIYSEFLLSATSLVAFASIIMTYFGVNYYLSGMHSYAAGDPVPIPTFVYYTIVVVFITIGLAFRKRHI